MQDIDMPIRDKGMFMAIEKPTRKANCKAPARLLPKRNSPPEAGKDDGQRIPVDARLRLLIEDQAEDAIRMTLSGLAEHLYVPSELLRPQCRVLAPASAAAGLRVANSAPRPDPILLKPGQRTSDAMAMMQMRARPGSDAIPVSARLPAVADVFDVLISVRVGKLAMSHAEAREIIAARRRRHIDSGVTDAFLPGFEDSVAVATQYLVGRRWQAAEGGAKE